MSNKDCYFYVQFLKRVCKLNISQLLLFKKGSTSKRPEFEVVFANQDEKFPIWMGLLSKGSNMHFVGGDKFFRSGNVSHSEFGPRTLPNLEVYTLDPTSQTLYKDSNFPNPSGPKSTPIVVTLGDENKVYVLSTDPNHFSDLIPEPPFEVFDFVSKTWEALPPPPDHFGGPIISHHAIGCKLYVNADLFSFVFDAGKAVWHRDIPFKFPNLACSLEYNGFLIAQPFNLGGLVAYNLDSFGIKSPYQCLDQLREVFEDPFYDSDCSLTRLDDNGRMCLLYQGMPFSYSHRFCARVAVFQVFVSNSTDNPVVTAVLEAVEEYDIDDFTGGDYIVYSTFIRYDGLNKDDTEADVTNSTLSGLDSRRGVGKHAAEFVTDADMHKKPKTTLC
ncbi:uncharacterized protein LOC126603688 isoform X1 [Malus sylvestris]|uniref:uncharacterized protein LOC126603688 isoform X1 n=1 Tax=Malus sylvestris TaxID=3752 RepID=UPI0021AC858B|nr:uncharacterized protein LOC126603688 isoform X1 [Malus sylvestris]XP_050126584.1 uncharacterized protein LOC126603688 isoform X1 [Malus sylvestris]XP_050126586.1 uncharacterized protein LOC126603688 isoform X1 [Malus sylvestris]